MNKLLICAATAFEINPLIQYLNANWQRNSNTFFLNNKFSIRVEIIGVGMMEAAYHLGKITSQESFDVSILAGVAGAFDKGIALGELCMVTKEYYGDLGAESPNHFIDIFELGLLEKDKAPFTLKAIENPYINTIPFNDLKHCTSISVNTVSGCQETIIQRKARLDVQIENMEGIAFHYACTQNKIPFAQIRAISNYVIPRDKSTWQMDLAISKLNQYLIQWIENNIVNEKI